MMRFFLAVAVMLAALAAWAATARAGEELTTWRAGDLITYIGACHDAEAMEAVAREGASPAVLAALGERCFVLKRPLAAQIDEWIVGPIDFGGSEVSVWRIRDAAGDTEYVLLFDDGGRHQKEARI